MSEDYEVLKELQEEFEGYTSGAQEEDFIDRLAIEIREIESKHKAIIGLNEDLLQRILSEQEN
jgi:hypothetical protein